MRFLRFAIGLVLVGICLRVAAQTEEVKSAAHSNPVEDSNTKPDSGRIVPQYAIDAAVNGRFDEALPAYRKNVETNPNDPEPHIELALILRSAGHIDEGLKECREGIRLGPDSPRAHGALAMFLAESGDFDGAIGELRQAVRLQPQEMKHLHDLAVVLAMAGQGEEAEKGLKRCIEVNQKYSEAFADLGLMYLQHGRFPAAIEKLTASLAIKETRKARLGRAVANFRNERSAAAVEDCNHVLNENQNDHEAYAYRAYANMRLGASELAVRDAERALATGNEFADLAYTVLGGVNLVGNDDASSSENLTKAIDLRTEQPLPFVLRALVRWRTGALNDCLSDLDAAIQTADDAQHLNLELNGYGWQVYKFRGFINLLGKKDSQAAISDLTQAIALNDKDADCYALRGWAYLFVADSKHALADLNQALTTMPDHRFGTFLLLSVLTSSPVDEIRDGRRAFDLATKACAHTEWKDVTCVEGLAAAYSEIGQFENAVVTEEKAIELSSGSNPSVSHDLKVWWNLGLTLNITVKEETAVKTAELYQQRKPHHLHPGAAKVTIEPAAFTHSKQTPESDAPSNAQSSSGPSVRIK